MWKRFQLGEGPRRGLLRDCETNGSSAALNKLVCFAHTFYFPVTAPSLLRLMCNVSGWWCSHHIRSQLRLHRYRMQCTTLCNICKYFPNFCKKSVHLTVSPGPKPGAGLWSSAYPSLHLILATTTRLEEWHVLRMGTSTLCSKYLPAHKSILP